MTVTNAIANLIQKLAALPGMKSAPNVPVEDAGVFPFGTAFETKGSLNTFSADMADQLVTLVAEVHVSRTLLGKAITQAMAFRDPFLIALLDDPTLGGSVSTTNDIRWSFGEMKWGGVPTIGYRFEVDVKVAISS